MITRVSFENFKALKKLDVDLSRLTLLVGKNSSGKTSVLQGILLASLVGVPWEGESGHTDVRLGMIFSGISDPRRLVTLPGPGPLRVALTDDGGRILSVEATLPEETVKYALPRFTVALTGHEPPSITVPAPDNDTTKPLAFLNSAEVRSFGSAAFLHLDARAMVLPSVAAFQRPSLRQDGGDLATVLSYFASAEREVLDAVTADLKRVVPQVRRIGTEPVAVTRLVHERVSVRDQTMTVPIQEQVPGNAFFVEMDTGRRIPADLLSEGTVLTLGLLVALRHPTCPRIVLADDIDRSLHPEAQAELVRCLRAILEQRPELQVVCTTHSAYMLDHVALDEVRVMRLDERGHALCRPLSDHPESQRWRKMLRTGEFWASIGDDWLLPAQGDGQ